MIAMCDTRLITIGSPEYARSTIKAQSCQRLDDMMDVGTSKTAFESRPPLSRSPLLRYAPQLRAKQRIDSTLAGSIFGSDAISMISAIMLRR
jgi:hypothetical protein